MKRALVVVCLLAGLMCAFDASAAVEYVRVCSLYGPGFYYIPGTDTCINASTGDARQQTEGGTWRSFWPYPEGNWTAKIKEDCTHGRVTILGTFHSTDFVLNPWMRKQTAPIALPLAADRFISRVYMSGGFYDPRIPARSGTNSATGFCVRSIDPTEIEQMGGGPEIPAWGDSLLPIGCVANSRIVNMPAAYAISATAAYPQIDTFFPTQDQTIVSGPYLYGSHLVITTDLGPGGDSLLMYTDTNDNTLKPLAGTLSVSVCVQEGLANAAAVTGDDSHTRQ